MYGLVFFSNLELRTSNFENEPRENDWKGNGLMLK